MGGLKAGARLVYRDTRICSLALECTQTERGSLRQPRQARNVSDNASPHAPRQKGSVAIDEYEQRLSGPPGAAGKAPSHGQESPAEDKAIEEDGTRTLFLLRLSPLMPFAPLSYAMGATPLRLTGFLIATGLGSAAGIFLYVYLGCTFEQMGDLYTDGSKEELWASTALSWIGVIATFVAVWIMGRRASAILQGQMDDDTPSHIEQASNA